MIKLRILFFVSLLSLLTSCSGDKATFYGKWNNPGHRSESLTFHKDGTFTASSGRENYQGYWDLYDKGHITMTINSGVDANIHTARYDAETGNLIITIAGNDIVMQREDE
jgi:major membrane immunogen (membrane-anchored lipoprotein)